MNKIIESNVSMNYTSFISHNNVRDNVGNVEWIISK